MARPSGDLKGTLALLVLRTLASSGPMHGYAITTHIQTASQDSLRVEEGSLYPALHRMEQDGWLRSSWGRTENPRGAILCDHGEGAAAAGSRAGKLVTTERRREPRAAVRLSRDDPENGNEPV